MRPSVRTYGKFKLDYRSEYYALSILSRNNRSALAKFKYGVAPLRTETGRFKRLSVDQQHFCFHFNGLVEDIFHVVTVCPLLDTLFANAIDLNSHFDTFSDIDKLCFVISSKDLIHVTTKAG